MRMVVLPYKYQYSGCIIQTLEIFSLSQKEESSKILFFMALIKISTTRIVYLWAALFLVLGIMFATSPSCRAASLSGKTYFYVYFSFYDIETLASVSAPINLMKLVC